MTQNDFGRIADDGTVYVRRPEGEETVVGQWAASGDPAEGLAFFVKRYEGLRGEAELLLTRLADGKANADVVSGVVTRLRDAVEVPNMVGDLSALTDLAGKLEAAAQARREAASAARAKAREQALAERTAVVEEAEALAASTQWKATGERFRELQEKWTALPRGDRGSRDAEQDLWKRFSAARSAFDRARRSHFNAMEASRKEATAVKEELIAKAASLAESTDWADTSRAYRELMDQWKAAPRAGRSEEDKLWMRFREAQDRFFTARAAAQSARDGDERVNATAKEALATEAEALLPITDINAARSALHTIQDRWNSIGHVPRNERDRIEGRLRRVEDAVRQFEADRWRRTDPAKRALAESTVATFAASLAKLEAEAATAEAAGHTAKANDLAGRIIQTRSLLAAAQRSLDEYSG